MIKASIVTIMIFAGLITLSKDKDKYLYYFYSEQDVKDIEIQGTAYKPMYIIMEKDTIQVTQISENNQPYRDTNPKLICIGIPEKYDYTNKGVYIHFKKFKKS